MVACDDTRHMVFLQPALHSDLAHLGEGLNLPDYPLCALLFVSDTVPGDAFLMTPVLPLDVAGRALHAARALVVKRRRGIVDRRASTLPCGRPRGIKIPSRSTVSRVFGELAANPWTLRNRLKYLRLV